MIVIAGTLKIAADEVHGLYAALTSLVPATLQEEGCMDYHFAIKDASEGTILVYERWRDAACLAAHLAAPQIGAVLGSWGSKIAMDVLKFDATNPRGPLD
ncbi:antibiotic biosynthesis monooxygenase [Novosphingobium sp. FSY-8]|uniref:Antibiotic biosynthesis monooxygenase n=1 Tax=Novosphingobium ovatum TaxID=1908523 RepID=A0ABW9XHV0_9SPHN|nr:antibiotic biosynthesis monooxygenase [Novosphingobium ovatum]NBC38071.1 antibiotic biosynthesis monooxygenase [Novosphingobium ovatum]